VLAVDGLTTRYGSITAVRQASLEVGTGEIVGLIGPNGAGKTTLLATVAGLLVPADGDVRLEGRSVRGWSPDRMLRAGLALVPERRRIFADLSIAENLQVAGVTRSRADREQVAEQMYELFPVLGERRTMAAGYLSGGEAQQLAIARALMSSPKIVLMDEPSLGLAPGLVDLVFGLIDRLRSEGRTLLVVEQNAHKMLEVADRAYVMRSGRIVAEGSAKVLRERPDLFDTFVGTSAP
jgi:branched-chain amino acid transport system ATP-binding protein